ncbi:unnamed protein product [Cuscuta campestris]|uniref:Uncharacterized protein n=1 Tax=Cuscuta campestris TaxID=132261 RepID=A0A484LTT8_9ASTE|nr:unnamed protein product [Cuscuta campestris]
MLRKKASFLNDAERSFYQQKVKTNLIIEGDKCTKYFHAMMRKHHALNSIPFITTEQGGVTTSMDEISDQFIGYYNNLFGTTTQEGLYGRGQRSPFSIGNETPGPDGFTPAFFKSKWNIVGQSLCEAVEEFFRSGRLLKEINHATVALIPKVKENPGVKDFRHIACSNVTYKVITKILSNRMSHILPGIIDSAQAAFVEGRNIMDNVLLTQQLVRRYARKITAPKYDLMLFSRGDIESVTVLADALNHFSQASGLRVNPQKSSIFLAREVKDNRQDILNLVQFPLGRLPVRYLGLPLTSQRASERDFAPLIAKIRNGVKEWLNLDVALSTLNKAIKWLRKSHHAHSNIKKMCRLATLSTVYHIWRRRNGAYIDQIAVDVHSTIQKIKLSVYKVMYRLFPNAPLRLGMGNG